MLRCRKCLALVVKYSYSTAIKIIVSWKHDYFINDETLYPEERWEVDDVCENYYQILSRENIYEAT